MIMVRSSSSTLLVIYACIALRVLANLPDAETAGSRVNAVRIFNSLHSALRQWGSSIHHNGVSFFPVTVPAGNLLYHGRMNSEIPQGPEWLALDIEHSTWFCREKPHLNWTLHTLVDSDRAAQHALGRPQSDGNHKPRGYLQTYRAARDLNLVLIDGQSAAISYPPLGTHDSQDYLLLDWPVVGDGGVPELNIFQRAQALCDLGASWGGVDGWIRDEVGFEIIWCDFAPGNGLELVLSNGVGVSSETGISPMRASILTPFNVARAAIARNHGFPDGRFRIDFSGMVTALAYADANTTNPDSSRADLPRLISTPRPVLRRIRDRVAQVFRARRGRATQSANWQGVADNMVSRFAPQISLLALDTTTLDDMRWELMTLLDPFLDYGAADADGLGVSPRSHDSCYQHYMAQVQMPLTIWTPEDLAVKAALTTVQRLICDMLFDVHIVMYSAEREQVADKIRGLARALMEELRWATWRECTGCNPITEICWTPMFPFGSKEHHDTPSCKNYSERVGGPNSYWFDIDGDWPFPPVPPPTPPPHRD